MNSKMIRDAWIKIRLTCVNSIRDHVQLITAILLYSYFQIIHSNPSQIQSNLFPTYVKTYKHEIIKETSNSVNTLKY